MRGRDLLRYHSGDVAEAQHSLELKRKLKEGLGWGAHTTGSAQPYLKTVTEVETKIKP